MGIDVAKYDKGVNGFTQKSLLDAKKKISSKFSKGGHFCGEHVRHRTANWITVNLSINQVRLARPYQFFLKQNVRGHANILVKLCQVHDLRAHHWVQFITCWHILTNTNSYHFLNLICSFCRSSGGGAAKLNEGIVKHASLFFNSVLLHLFVAVRRRNLVEISLLEQQLFLFVCKVNYPSVLDRAALLATGNVSFNLTKNSKTLVSICLHKVHELRAQHN